MTAHLSLQAEQERMIRDQRIQDALFGAMPSARAGALRAEPQASQAKPLIAIARKANDNERP